MTVRQDDVPGDGQIATRWLLLDKAYRAHGSYGQDAANSIRQTRQDGSLLLTAPHAVHHYKDVDMKDKKSDAKTGGLCELLGQEIPASTLIASGFVEEWTTWRERTDEFAQTLKHAVESGMFVIDLHGLSDRHGVDICIGMGPKPSERSRQVAKELQVMLNPFSVSIGRPFNAEKPRTVTSYVQSLGGEGLQLEIAARLRRPEDDPSTAAQFVELLIDSLMKIRSLLV